MATAVDKHIDREHQGGASSGSELREQQSIRSATLTPQSKATTIQERERGEGDQRFSRLASVLEESEPSSQGRGPQGRGIAGAGRMIVGTDGGTELDAARNRFGGGFEARGSEGPGAQNLSVNQTPSFGQGILSELDGPRPTLTRQEKLSQLWKILDEVTSTPQDFLNVRARMPVTLEGGSVVDILIMDSPQGQIFVAFIRNKNEFKFLRTMDRRALLPDNPSAALKEAARIAYVQLQQIASGASSTIEGRMMRYAVESEMSSEVLAGLRNGRDFAIARAYNCDEMISALVADPEYN